MPKSVRTLLALIATLVILTVTLGSIVWVITTLWHKFINLNPNLAAALLTASTTFLVATLGVILGRYLQTKAEIQAHFRDKKSEIYDAFLKEFWKVYHSEDPSENTENPQLIAFLREWQRQVILWGGANMLIAFLEWWEHLKRGRVDAKSLYLMEKFFFALRRDLGLSNWGLKQGTFIRLMLRNSDVFFLMTARDPNVLLQDVATMEKELGRE